MGDRAFFYFRDPAYVRSLPEEQQRAFRNADPEAAAKLAALKERIRQQHREGKLKTPPRENYTNAEVLGHAVQLDFTSLINTLFPKDEKPDALEREAARHEAFACSRAVMSPVPGRPQGVYVGRKSYFDKLDHHARGCDPPLVVVGESGSGKSALWPIGRWLTATTHPFS